MVCREVFGLADYVREVEALDNVVPTAAQTALYLEFRRLLDRSVRWFLTAAALDARHRRRDRAVPRRRARAAPQVPDLLRGDERKRRLDRQAAELVKAGVPDELAVRAAIAARLVHRCSTSSTSPPTPAATPSDVAPLYYLVSERFGIDAMLSKVTALPRDDRWDALARGALRDDLYSVLESLTRSVIEVGDGAGADPAAQWEAWEKANKESMQRGKTSLSAIRRLDTAQHRGPVGGAAHAALGHPGRRLDLTPAARPRVPTFPPDPGTFTSAPLRSPAKVKVPVSRGRCRAGRLSARSAAQPSGR